MATFSDGSTRESYALSWDQSRHTTNGTACVSEEPGNVLSILWIEVIAFQVAVLIVLLVALYYYIFGLTVVRERNRDVILCRDERRVDKTKEGRLRDAPDYHLFTLDMALVGSSDFYGDPSYSESAAQFGAVQID